MATDLIVNKWGITDYCLHVYGDMERAPAIASQCQEIIASKGLREHVILKGLGNPSVVLQDAVSSHFSTISDTLLIKSVAVYELFNFRRTSPRNG